MKKIYILIILVSTLLFNNIYSNTSNNSNEFTDDFSNNSLNNTSRYVEFYSNGFNVLNGVLRLDSKPNEKCFLNILPMFGKRSTFSIDFKWIEGIETTLILIADWRYTFNGTEYPIYISLSNNTIYYKLEDTYQTKNYSFKKNIFTNVRLERSKNNISMFINNEKIFESTLTEKTGTYCVPEEANYGGFAFGIEPNPGSKDGTRIIEFDNLFVDGDKSPVEYKSEVKQFQIENKDYLFSIIYENGFEKWAIGQINVTIPFLIWSADFYGIPPISNRLGMAQTKGSYYDIGRGFNNWGIVYGKAYKEYPDTLSYHELAHNWQHLYGKKWNIEGMANILWERYLENTKNTFRRINFIEKGCEYIVNNNLTKMAIEMDLDNDKYFELNSDPSKDIETGFGVAYWKASVFSWILYRILGSDGFREFNRNGLKLGRGLSSEDMLQIARNIVGKDLNDVFKGWVFKGKGLFDVNDLFKDSDNDNLCDLDEKLIKTNFQNPDSDNDGYGDYGEINTGYNPLNKNEPQKGSIIIDGIFSDWNNIKILANDKNDVFSPCDVKSVKIIGDKTNRILLANIELFETSNNNEYIDYITFDIAFQNNYDINYRVNLYIKNNKADTFLTTGNLTYSSVWKPENWKYIDSSQIKFIYRDNLIEISIPTALIGDKDSFFVYLMSGSSKQKTDWIDENPLKIAIDQLYPKLPAKVWTPSKW